MKAYCHIILLASITLLATSCIKEGYGADCPGSIDIVYDWNSSPGATSEDSLSIVIVNGKDTIRINTGCDAPGTSPDLEEGSYEVTGSESAENVTVTGCEVSVNLLPDGTIAEPGIFNGGTTILVVSSENSENRIDIPMRQQTRPLGVRVKIEGTGAEKLIRAEGELDGIAQSRHINHGFTPVNNTARNPALKTGKVRYTLLANEEDFFDQKQLLGIDGDASQILNLQFILTDGEVKTQTLDVTRQLDEFHTEDVTKPCIILLIIRIEEDPVSGSISATITDWRVGTEDDLVAEEQR